MNCCDDFGNCTRGPNCPARASRQDQADPEQADSAAWRGLIRSTFILLLGIAIGAIVSIAAIAAGMSAGG